MIYIYIVLGLLTVLFYIRLRLRSNPHRPPSPSGWLPIIGHTLSFGSDNLNFFKRAQSECGAVFEVQIGFKTMVIISDPELTKPFFESTESEMSLYRVLENLYFERAFGKKPGDLQRILKILKKTISVKYEEFAPKIISQANVMVERLRTNSSKVDLTSEMIRFIAHTSANCFIGIDLEPEFYDILVKFTHLLNRIIVLTYFIPIWLIRYSWLGSQLNSYRKQMSLMLIQIIESKNSSESMMIRAGLDFVDTDGSKLSVEDISYLIISLLYVSSENTALGLAATMTALAYDVDLWDKVFGSISPNLKSVTTSELLHASILEAGRLNCHVVGINRVPVSTKYIGKFYVGHADSVALCSPLMMTTGPHASKLFSDVSKFDPERLIKSPDLKSTVQMMLFGHGMHICPGRMFALLEIKAAIAAVMFNFERPQLEFKSDLNYFSPSAFAERKISTQFLPKPFQTELEMSRSTAVSTAKIDIGASQPFLMVGPHPIFIFRNYLNVSEQFDIYSYTFDLSKGSAEHTEIQSVKSTTAYPLAYNRLAYTGFTSNCKSEPTKLLDLTRKVWGLTGLDFVPEFNSVYAQLFGGETPDRPMSMAMHFDSYVDWGVSINLGASCVFVVEDSDGKFVEFELNSGDIMICDFSKIKHGIKSIDANSTPKWFGLDKTDLLYVETYNRVRMSIQIRNSSIVPPTVFSIKEFKQMLIDVNA